MRKTKRRNSAVKKILVRSKISLACVEFSSNAQSIFLNGKLLKTTGLEVPAHEVISLVTELSTLGSIKTELENWFLTNDSIYYLNGIDLESAC